MRSMTPPHILYIQRDLYCKPLLWKLDESGLFEVRYDSPAQNAVRLREREADVAFVTPLDYGRESSDYEIIGDVVLASRSGNDSASLFFALEIKDIRSVAVHPGNVAEVLLTKIILAEEFEVEPVFVPSESPFQELGIRADAALLVGDASLARATEHPQRMDLVDLWNGMTGLPFVHGFWCARRETLAHEAMKALRVAAHRGAMNTLEIIGDEKARQSSGLSIQDARRLFSSLSFVLGEEEQSAIQEFLHLAYYHGALPDIAELNISTPRREESGEQTISPN